MKASFKIYSSAKIEPIATGEVEGRSVIDTLNNALSEAVWSLDHELNTDAWQKIEFTLHRRNSNG